MRKLEGFADYPIEVGGKWIHGYPGKVLGKIVNDPQVQLDGMETIRYTAIPCYSWDDGKFYKYRENWKADHFFIDYRWADFVQDYFAKHVEAIIEYNCPVTSID